MRSLLADENAGAVNLILFFVTIFSCGGLFMFLIIEVGLPTFGVYIPDDDVGVFIRMCIYSIPILIAVVGTISLLISGIRERGGYYQ